MSEQLVKARILRIDTAHPLYGQEVDLRERVLLKPNLVETALGLLNQGEYGTCQECGDSINPKRLEAIPWTTMCIGCQELHDDPEGEKDVRKAA